MNDLEFQLDLQDFWLNLLNIGYFKNTRIINRFNQKSCPNIFFWIATFIKVEPQ